MAYARIRGVLTSPEPKQTARRSPMGRLRTDIVSGTPEGLAWLASVAT